MGSATAGVLTALRGLPFAVVGALAVALVRRAGINGTIAACGVAIVAAGLLLRSVVDSAVPFLLLTALAFAGMAVGNILVPAFIKRHGGTRTALLNSVYGTTLAVGATPPLLITAPLAASGPDGWQASLRVWGATALVAALAAATGAGYLGLLLAPDTVPWLWALLLGAGGFAFPTALALITGRSRDPRVTAELSGFCQPVGYLLAAVGPFAIGALHAATESWALPLIILIGFSVAMAAAGVAAAAPRFVDDQLSRNPAQGT